MKDDFIIYFDRKEIVIQILFALFFGPILLSVATVIILKILNGEFDLKQIIVFVPFIIGIIYVVSYWLYTIVYFFFKIILKKKKKL